MYQISERDLAAIRRRHWAMKAEQERGEMERHPEPPKVSRGCRQWCPGVDTVPLVPYTPGKDGGIWL